jgi:hypothetical protein
MSYREKYFKYKTKYLALQNQLGGRNMFGDDQFPRYATLQFNSNELRNFDSQFTSNYVLEVRPFYMPSDGELLEQLEGNYKCIASFNKRYYLDNLELFNTKYLNKIIFVYFDELTTDIPEGENIW